MNVLTGPLFTWNDMRIKLSEVQKNQNKVRKSKEKVGKRCLTRKKYQLREKS